MNAIPIQALPERHLQPHQARQRPPTSFDRAQWPAVDGRVVPAANDHPGSLI